MTFDAFLDGLNKGGFAFLGMVLVAAILLGLIRAGNWLFTKGWPELMSSIKEAATTYQSTVQVALDHSTKVQERQAMMQDSLMASHKEVIGEVRSVVTEVRNLTDKIGGK